MKQPHLVVALGLAAFLTVFGTAFPYAQDGVTRTDLQTADLSIPGREVVQQMVVLQPRVVVARHTHPGEEVTVVLEGSILLEVDGKPAATYKAGQAFTVPPGIIHGVTSNGSTPAKLVATYIVEKGKPLRTAAP